eukprot:1205874-Pleurochrysis_carterae.AAC.2
MLEGLAVSILERVLGEYVEGIDKKSLKLAVWKGHISLTNLTLRREACYALGLPIDVKTGYVQSVEVQIPWNKLGSEPVSVTLNGVYLVCAPLDTESMDERALKAWGWARKQAELRTLAERAASRQAKGDGHGRGEGSGDGDGDGEVASGAHEAGGSLSLISRIIKNLQLSLRSVHARFEDSSSSAEPFAAGVTLEELAVYSTDAAGNRAFSAHPDEQARAPPCRPPPRRRVRGLLDPSPIEHCTVRLRQCRTISMWHDGDVHAAAAVAVGSPSRQSQQ